MREVAPEIYMITEKETGRVVKFSVNVYVIAGKDGLVFDSGYGTRRTRRYLIKQIRSVESLMVERGEECRITRVIPSHGHWDHFSGLAFLREKLGMTILATEQMMRSIGSAKHYRDSFRGETDIADVPSTKPVMILQALTGYFLDHLWFKVFGVSFIKDPVEIIPENSTLTVNGETWEVIAAHGHCDDDIVLFNRNRGILLAGDIVLRSVTTWLGPPRSDIETYMKTLETLMELPGLKLILAAHGSPVTNPYERLSEALEHRKKRTGDVLDVIKRSGRKGITFEALFKRFYPAARFYDKLILRGWILSTIEYLLKTCMIDSEIRGGKKVFRAR